MDTHNLNSFSRPFLKFDNLNIISDSEFEIKYEEVELTISSGDAHGISQKLEALRFPEAPLWKDVLKQSEPLFSLLDSLQHYGFVYEQVNPVNELNDTCLTDLYGELFALLHVVKLPEASILQSLRAELRGDVIVDDLTILTTEKNLFLLCLRLSIKAWRNICPPVLNIADKLLESISSGSLVSRQLPAMECYSLSEIRRCGLVFVWCLSRSSEVDANRMITEIPQFVNKDMGTNLAILTERWAVNSLANLGPSQFVEALQDPATQLRLAQASYAQEYYITDRFIDIIAPAISHRVSRPLKKLIRKYYAEETGHDKYELKTCQRLGLTYEDLQRCLPTPFSQILCDVFTYLAINDPISYFSAITITEGLPGQPNILNNIIADSKELPESCNHESRHHESLNETLNHPMISRIFLSQCGKLDVSTLQRAFEFYAALLEIGWRSWNELYRLHVTQDKPAVNFDIHDFIAR